MASLSRDRLDRFETIFDYRTWRETHLQSASKLIADEFAALVNDDITE